MLNISYDGELDCSIESIIGENMANVVILDMKDSLNKWAI